MSTNTCVWIEIPVTDLDRAQAFYGAVLGRELSRTDGEPNPMVALTDMFDEAVSGHLYPGQPAAPGTGPTVYFAAPDSLDTTAQRVREAGGTVVRGPVTIPQGAFFYATDPDGNSIAFFANESDAPS